MKRFALPPCRPRLVGGGAARRRVRLIARAVSVLCHFARVSFVTLLHGAFLLMLALLFGAVRAAIFLRALVGSRAALLFGALIGLVFGCAVVGLARFPFVFAGARALVRLLGRWDLCCRAPPDPSLSVGLLQGQLLPSAPASLCR
jgi:hypothetical protein